ncbi:MAG: bifunctional chorismate mutase/prephenate dehydrogenase, partial [Myxococcales bacterium]|nr:bifunctional chorismate mutase/prephenate dehydrogenase [Myxococcales bacterium]
MTDVPPAPRPLAALRAMIDAVDRELLQSIARRMGIVAEVAEHKRHHRIRIRDVERERSLLADRADRAEKLGLPPATIESVYRLLLMASREHQAALRAEVPIQVEPRTIAVLGGEGGMGRMLARLFGDLGHAVIVADTRNNVSNVEAAKAAEVVVVSVPIEATADVIREVGPHVRADGLLMDVTSIKGEPMRAMLDATKASVVGTHPMFGPSLHTVQGQRVVVCRGRGDAWYEWVTSTLASRGLVITECSPEEHDQVMAVVQVLNHFRTQVMGLALSRLGIPFERTLAFTSPAYLLESYVTARHFAQDPALYGPIEMRNPDTARVTAAFVDAASDLAAILERKDQKAFAGVFDRVRAFFGAFSEEA